MKTISKEALVEFVLENDFAFVYGAGYMTANDQETRENIANFIHQDGKVIEEVEELEGTRAAELLDEKKTGCTIYKVYSYNEEAMYIAYYE